MRKIIYLLLAVFFLACAEEKKNIPTEFDYGKVENGVYTNTYFDLKIPYDSKWIVQDQQQMANLAESGGELIAGDNEQLKSVVEASKVNTAYLFTVFRYEVGAAVDFNPSMIVIAENTKNFPGIKNGKDYLFHSKKLLEQSQMPYVFDQEIYEQTIGDQVFHNMNARLDVVNNSLTQEYICTVSNGFSLAIIISYMTEEQKAELYAIIDAIEM